MKTHLPIVVALAVLLFFPARSSAMPPNEPWSIVLALDKLRPWFDDIGSSISRSPDFPALINAMHDPITCTFDLNSDGTIKNLKVEVSSGYQSLDKKCLQLLCATAPFKQPPNDLPFQRGLAVTLCDPGGHCYPKSINVGLHRLVYHICPVPGRGQRFM
jgi:TonB family protein